MARQDGDTLCNCSELKLKSISEHTTFAALRWKQGPEYNVRAGTPRDAPNKSLINASLTSFPHARSSVVASPLSSDVLVQILNGFSEVVPQQKDHFTSPLLRAHAASTTLVNKLARWNRLARGHNGDSGLCFWSCSEGQLDASWFYFNLIRSDRFCICLLSQLKSPRLSG